MRRSSVTDLGDEFVAALVDGDGPGLAGTLAEDVQMRALIPPGPIEVLGAEAVAGKFSVWFGSAEQVELVRSDSQAVADRLHVSYRLRVKRPGDQWKVVEQHLLCAHDGGRICAVDLVCTGFRPDDANQPRGVIAARRTGSAATAAG
jgi:hypothetical protein